ncbi:MAG: T9SS type A sorting domain-containing protein [Phaeodactylibacter sp.]|nr:T9SS type A sorting domain-containing protein [Phaeodactylibacter sp.]
MKRFLTGLCTLFIYGIVLHAQPVTLIKDIYPGEEGCIPAGFSAPTTTPNIAIGNTFFFAAEDGVHGTELWKSDGTEAGTVLVKDINPGEEGSDPYNFHILNDTLFFFAENPDSGLEVWYSDGTEAGTDVLLDIQPGSKSGIDFTSRMAVAGELLFFTATTSEAGRELWRSDGSSEGTFIVRDINAGSQSTFIQNLYGWNGVLYYGGEGDFTDSNGLELWRSDGTEEGTFMVKNIHEANNFSSGPRNFQAAGDLLYFWADSDGIGTELWRTDGTEEGTQLVKDIAEGSASALLESDYELHPIGNQMLFVASPDGSDSTSLFITDGTAGNTIALFSAANTFNPPYAFETFNNEVYFFGDDGTVDGLRKTDGTPEGTVYVENFFDISFGTYTSDIITVNDRLVVAASLSGGEGHELYQSDANGENFSLIEEIHPAFSFDSRPRNLRLVDDRLFFAATDGEIGDEYYVFEPEPFPLTGSLNQTASNPCHDDSEAALSVTIQGGVPPYSYTWNIDTIQGPNPMNLPPGQYTVTVTDNDDTTLALAIEIGPDPLVLTEDLIFPEEEGQANGSITLDLDGGTPPYNYNWDPEVQPGATLFANNLTAGEYSLTVTDANGCTTSGSFTVGLITNTQQASVEWWSKIHPNPTSQTLFLTLKASVLPEEITLYNANGQIVFTSPFTNQIDMSALPSGVYWLRTHGNAGVQVQQVSKR